MTANKEPLVVNLGHVDRHRPRKRRDYAPLIGAIRLSVVAVVMILSKAPAPRLLAVPTRPAPTIGGAPNVRNHFLRFDYGRPTARRPPHIARSARPGPGGNSKQNFGGARQVGRRGSSYIRNAGERECARW
jgi:hypothetical protein